MINLVHHLAIPLQQRRNRLLHLKSRWSNPLATALRFESHISNAKRIAERVAGASAPPLLTWTVPTVLVVKDSFEEGQAPHDDNLPASVNGPDSDQAVVADILAADKNADHDINLALDTDSRAEGASAVTVWAIPVCITISVVKAILTITTG
jgi:hypothetical protein